MFLATAPRYVSAVTGAAMLIEREFWDQAGGLDIAFAKTLQDADLCMRAATAGRRIVYVPNSVIFHMESVSARSTYTDPATVSARARELEVFERKLAAFGADPFHNASFDPDDERLHRLVARPRAGKELNEPQRDYSQ
jgi:GT2 family glycosyltransferase